MPLCEYTGSLLLLFSAPIHSVGLACCQCEHGVAVYISLVLNTHSTGAEVAGIQKIFSNSSCKSANSFFYLTSSQRVPWFIHRDSRAL